VAIEQRDRDADQQATDQISGERTQRQRRQKAVRA
jgi:hypothetical protein